MIKASGPHCPTVSPDNPSHEGRQQGHSRPRKSLLPVRLSKGYYNRQSVVLHRPAIRQPIELRELPSSRIAIFGFGGTAVDQGISLDVATNRVACQRGGRVQLSVDGTCTGWQLRFLLGWGRPPREDVVDEKRFDSQSDGACLRVSATSQIIMTRAPSVSDPSIFPAIRNYVGLSDPSELATSPKADKSGAENTQKI